jgi:hypothetical protein
MKRDGWNRRNEANLWESDLLRVKQREWGGGEGVVYVHSMCCVGFSVQKGMRTAHERVGYVERVLLV